MQAPRTAIESVRLVALRTTRHSSVHGINRKTQRHRTSGVSALRACTHRRPCDQSHRRTCTVGRCRSAPHHSLKIAISSQDVAGAALTKSPWRGRFL